MYHVQSIIICISAQVVRGTSYHIMNAHRVFSPFIYHSIFTGPSLWMNMRFFFHFGWIILNKYFPILITLLMIKVYQKIHSLLANKIFLIRLISAAKISRNKRDSEVFFGYHNVSPCGCVCVWISFHLSDWIFNLKLFTSFSQPVFHFPSLDESQVMTTNENFHLKIIFTMCHHKWQ